MRRGRVPMVGPLSDAHTVHSSKLEAFTALQSEMAGAFQLRSLDLGLWLQPGYKHVSEDSIDA